MTTKRSELKGIIPPLLTPTNADDRVNEPALRKSVRWLIGQGVDALFVGGSAGEGPQLTFKEYVRLAEIVHSEAGSAVPLLGGVMESSTQRVIEKINVLKQIGYAYYVVTPTYYTPGKTHNEQIRLFGACKEAAGEMELVPYNLPGVVQTSIPVQTMVELGKRGWARYCKESSGDAKYMRDLLAAAPAAGLTVFSGSEVLASDALRGGAKGLVNVCANFEPKTYIALIDAIARGDNAKAAIYQQRIDKLVKGCVLLGTSFLAGPKYAVARRIGFDYDAPLSPLEPLDEAQKKSLTDLMDHGVPE